MQKIHYAAPRLPILRNLQRQRSDKNQTKQRREKIIKNQKSNKKFIKQNEVQSYKVFHFIILNFITFN